MSSNFQLGENAPFIIICGILAVIAVLFFVIVFIADFGESRKKAKKRRGYERAVHHAHKRRQKAL